MSRAGSFAAQPFGRGNDGRPPQSSISHFKEEVGQFVVETFSLIRKNMSEEKSVIEGLIQALQSYYSRRQESAATRQESAATRQESAATQQQGARLIGPVQAAVEQLNRQSESLSERLFDLSQQLVQQKIFDFQREKQKMRQEHWSQLGQMKKQFTQQQATIQQEMNRYRVKCQLLQNCLNQQFGSKNPQFQDQLRRKELSKYLQLIQELSQEIRLLKNSLRRDKTCREFACLQSELNAASEVCSERQQYGYQEPPYDQVTHISKSTRPTTEYYQNEYYQRTNGQGSSRGYQSYQRDMQRGKLRRESGQRGSSLSKERHFLRNGQTNQGHLPHKSRLPQRQCAYLTSQGSRHTRRSIDKLNDESPIPLVLHTKNEPIATKLLQSARRSDNYTVSTQHQRLQQRNLKLEAVQEKLHGLKRTLSKELRNINY